MTRRNSLEQPPVDEVAEAFWARYSKGDPNYLPPIVDNTIGRLKALEYLQEVSEGERKSHEETSHLRFVG